MTSDRKTQALASLEASIDGIALSLDQTAALNAIVSAIDGEPHVVEALASLILTARAERPQGDPRGVYAPPVAVPCACGRLWLHDATDEAQTLAGDGHSASVCIVGGERIEAGS